jgi:hypothetical protein
VFEWRREIEEDDQRVEGHGVPLPSDHPLLSLFSTQTLSMLGITPYLMSLYPLIILFYLSSPLKH